MKKKIKVKPAEGVKVLDESGTPIPKEGIQIFKTTFISRRIKEGSLVIVEEQKEQAPTNAPRGRAKK